MKHDIEGEFDIKAWSVKMGGGEVPECIISTNNPDIALSTAIHHLTEIADCSVKELLEDGANGNIKLTAIVAYMLDPWGGRIG